VPAYAYGPGLLSVAHGPNEYVDLRKMIDCAAICAGGNRFVEHPNFEAALLHDSAV
jgi:hypothetical protein